jgi:glycosyltransferase involved in cell wall biosynthesis
VGRFVPEKGIFSLLDAFSMLLKNFSNVQLLIVGSGAPQIRSQIVKSINENRIGRNVKFLGSIPYSLMPKIHNLADLFCLPSIPTRKWEEQFGFSLVEAMACGKPVVSTLTGSIPEVVKDRSTGLLVEPNDSTALRAALDTLIADEKTRMEFGRNGRQWVLQRFEANNVAQQLADIYTSHAICTR